MVVSLLNYANVITTSSPDVYINIKNDLFQFRVHKISAENNACFNFLKASNAFGVGYGVEVTSFKNLFNGIAIMTYI